MNLEIKWAVCVIASLALSQALAPPAAIAAINASATLTSQPAGPNFQYSITLNNTGTTPIGTFWFGWIPHYDFLPSLPTVPAASQPPGWTGAPVADGFLGGYSIEWTTATPLAAGQSLSGFTFTTPDSPTVINGIGNIGDPVETSYAYMGMSQSGLTPGDSGVQFTTVTIAPEPVLAAFLLPGMLLLRRGRNR